ncbi:MAG: hypothetical protein ABFS56_04980 [Pseudomonadota bacterium]
MTDGAGGYRAGKIIRNNFKKIKRNRIKKFLGFIKTEKFWGLPTHNEDFGHDGAQ